MNGFTGWVLYKCTIYYNFYLKSLMWLYKRPMGPGCLVATLARSCLTFGPRSNIDSSNRISYWWSTHLECLSGPDKLLQINIFGPMSNLISQLYIPHVGFLIGCQTNLYVSITDMLLQVTSAVHNIFQWKTEWSPWDVIVVASLLMNTNIPTT